MVASGTMLELMQDLTPFVYDKTNDKVQYAANYRHHNPDLFKAEH